MVKRVVHRRTGEGFAAKFLPLRNCTRTRAFQERDLLSRLAHPRVACLLDFFCTRRTLVLVTEVYPEIPRRIRSIYFLIRTNPELLLGFQIRWDFRSVINTTLKTCSLSTLL